MTPEQILALLNKDSQLTNEEKRLIYKAMARQDSFGQSLRIDFAAAQGPELLPILKEESFVETMFRRDNTNGEQRNYPIRSKKVRSAWGATGTDSNAHRFANQKDVQFNQFWLQASGHWQLDYLKQGNIKLVDNQLQDMVSDLAYKVNYAGMSLVKTAEVVGDIQNIPILTGAPNGGATLSLPVIQTIMTYMEKKSNGRVKTTDIFLSVTRYNELVELAMFASAGTWTNSGTTPYKELSLPEATRQKILDGGINSVSSIYLSNFGITLHKVRRLEFVNDDKAYALDSTSFGVMPVDVDLETMADNAAANRYETGIQGRQRQGFGILDAEAAAVYSFSAAPHANDTLYNDIAGSLGTNYFNI